MGEDGIFRALSSMGAAVVDRDGLECAKLNLDAGVCNTPAGLCVCRGGIAIEVAAQSTMHACSGSGLLGAR